MTKIECEKCEKQNFDQSQSTNTITSEMKLNTYTANIVIFLLVTFRCDRFPSDQHQRNYWSSSRDGDGDSGCHHFSLCTQDEDQTGSEEKHKYDIHAQISFWVLICNKLSSEMKQIRAGFTKIPNRV